jgi:hypothetical protein
VKEARALVPMWAPVYTAADGEQYITAEDAARVADVSVETVRRWAAEGRVASVASNGSAPSRLLVGLCDVRQLAAVRSASRVPPPPGVDLPDDELGHAG